MANTVSNVVAGKPLVTGGVLFGPTGTALPTDVTTPLDASLVFGGYVSEDGLTENADRSTDKIKAWGGDTVKVVQSEFSLTYEFTFIEAVNADVLKTVYGIDNVTTTPATAEAGALQSVKLTSETLPHQVFVFEIKDGDARIRIAIPDGQVTAVGEVTYVDDNVVGYAVTVEAFQDADGVNAYKYLTDGKAAAA